MLKSISHTVTDFEKDGFALLKAVISSGDLDSLTDAIEAVRDSQLSPGLRNLLVRSAVVGSFAYDGAASRIAQVLLRSGARPVRAILFDKTADSNWYVTWHQDLTIPVRKKIEIDGFGRWSVKEGVVHVCPPSRILEGMVSLRIHLDDCHSDNGAIKFIAGSQLEGILEAEEIASFRDNRPCVVCPADRGDVIAMRPLTLHSSSTAEKPGHRRVLHIEYAGVELPAGLEFAEA